jgi:hypothetical protein
MVVWGIVSPVSTNRIIGYFTPFPAQITIEYQIFVVTRYWRQRFTFPGNLCYNTSILPLRAEDYTMQPNKSLFFSIIGLAVLAVLAMFVAVFFFADTLNLSTTPPQTNIQVVAAPALKPWLDQAAQEFNQSQPNTRVDILAADTLIPENRFSAQASATPPAAWIAEASFVVAMAADRGLIFDPDTRPVAGSPLAWGAYTNKQESFTQQYGPLGWDSLAAKAAAPGDFLTLVIASPANSAEGLAALASAVAAQFNTGVLSGADVSQATARLSETLAGNTRTPPKPAEAFATAQGRSLGDAGLLSMAAWQRAGLHTRPDFTLTPVTPPVNLDYPFAIYTGSRATVESRQAAAAFRDYLLTAASQQKLAAYFFDPPAPAAIQLDAQAGWALLRWAERELR